METTTPLDKKPNHKRRRLNLHDADVCSPAMAAIVTQTQSSEPSLPPAEAAAKDSTTSSPPSAIALTFCPASPCHRSLFSVPFGPVLDDVIDDSEDRRFSLEEPLARNFNSKILFGFEQKKRSYVNVGDLFTPRKAPRLQSTTTTTSISDPASSDVADPSIRSIDDESSSDSSWNTADNERNLAELMEDDLNYPETEKALAFDPFFQQDMTQNAGHVNIEKANLQDRRVKVHPGVWISDLRRMDLTYNGIQPTIPHESLIILDSTPATSIIPDRTKGSCSQLTKTLKNIESGEVRAKKITKDMKVKAKNKQGLTTRKNRSPKMSSLFIKVAELSCSETQRRTELLYIIILFFRCASLSSIRRRDLISRSGELSNLRLSVTLRRAKEEQEEDHIMSFALSKRRPVNCSSSETIFAVPLPVMKSTGMLYSAFCSGTNNDCFNSRNSERNSTPKVAYKWHSSIDTDVSSFLSMHFWMVFFHEESLVIVCGEENK